MLPRLEANIDRIEDGCWLWTASLSPGGYGKAYYEHRHWRAHRLIYTLLVGPIPDGLTLDHLCSVRACVNPAHLEPCDAEENKRRGRRPWSTHDRCVNGHPFDYVNVKGHRYCRTCNREKLAQLRATGYIAPQRRSV